MERVWCGNETRVESWLQSLSAGDLELYLPHLLDELLRKLYEDKYMSSAWHLYVSDSYWPLIHFAAPCDDQSELPQIPVSLLHT